MSMRNLTGHVNTKTTPQNQPIPGTTQVENSAGGFTWEVDKWTRLNRFLVLGSEGGTYYASEKTLTVENAKVLMDLVTEDGLRVVRTIVEVSQAGRAPKNDPAIFALALCAKMGNEETKQAAYLALPQVCRIGTHLFQFAEAIKAFGGFSSGTQRALARWYQGTARAIALPEGIGVDQDMIEGRTDFATAPIDRHPAWLALQAVKYQAREGWSHRDLLRLAKPGAKGRRVTRTPGTDAVFNWITKGTLDEAAPAIVKAFESAKAIGLADEGKVTAAGVKSLVALINNHGLPRECVPTTYLNEVEVWDALLDNGGRGMPLTAMIRNLGKMSSIGLLKPMSGPTGKVIAALGNADALRKARVHPLGVLVALNTYRSGQGVRGSLSWSPNAQVVDALDKAFYLSFGAVEVTGKRYLLALDISGSMGSPNIANMPGITPRVGSAAMALVTAAVEPQHHIVGFTCQSDGTASWNLGRSNNTLQNFWLAPAGSKCNMFGGGRAGVSELAITPRQRLDDVTKYIEGLPMGGTDCAAPMQYAMERGIETDMFVIFTDSETWAGDIHPSQALQAYRKKTGINAKLVVVGMVASAFTIADPKDRGQMDVVGFDLATPNIIGDFAMGRI